MVSIRHYFSLPDISPKNWGQIVYHRAPWIISKRGGSWIYRGIGQAHENSDFFQLAIFNRDHTRGRIFHPDPLFFQKGDGTALTFSPTDQILLSRIIVDRQGCLLHAAGMIIQGQGVLFIGHSGAGKSTIATLMKDDGEILCDDRIIVRRWPEGFRLYGTWSHGDVLDVSPSEAPLRAICFLNQSQQNRLVPISNRKERICRLTLHLVRALEAGDWWQKALDVVESLADAVPVYELQFNKSDEVRAVLRTLLDAR